MKSKVGEKVRSTRTRLEQTLHTHTHAQTQGYTTTHLEHADAAILVLPLVALAINAIRVHARDEHTVKNVAEGPMAQVMDQS